MLFFQNMNLPQLWHFTWAALAPLLTFSMSGHMPHVTCHVSNVTYHLSLMPPATDPHPANSPTMHSRLDQPKTPIKIEKRKKFRIQETLNLSTDADSQYQHCHEEKKDNGETYFFFLFFAVQFFLEGVKHFFMGGNFYFYLFFSFWMGSKKSLVQGVISFFEWVLKKIQLARSNLIF